MTVFQIEKNDKKPGHDRNRTYHRRPIGDKGGYFAHLLAFIMDTVGIPEYLHAKSNHIFSHRQKIAMSVMKAYLNRSYERFCDDLGMFSGFVRILGIKHIPHPSTLKKFMSRVDRKELELVISGFAYFSKDDVYAMDGTCFSDFNRSAHYVKRLGDFGRSEGKRTFTKASTVVGIRDMIVVAAHSSEGRQHDSKHVPSLMESMERNRHLDMLDVKYILADKGYDAEWIHRMISEKTGAGSLIPVRVTEEGRLGSGRFRTKGIHRVSAKRLLKDDAYASLYRMRPKVECSNYCIKELTGSYIREKNADNKCKMALFKILAYNCNRVFDLGYREWSFS